MNRSTRPWNEVDRFTFCTGTPVFPSRQVPSQLQPPPSFRSLALAQFKEMRAPAVSARWLAGRTRNDHIQGYVLPNERPRAAS